MIVNSMTPNLRISRHNIVSVSVTAAITKARHSSPDGTIQPPVVPARTRPEDTKQRPQVPLKWTATMNYEEDTSNNAGRTQDSTSGESMIDLEGGNRRTTREMIQQAWNTIFRRQERTPATTGRLMINNGQENLAWGHPLTENDPQYTRLYSVNNNGLFLYRDGGQFDKFCQVMAEVQGNVGCIQEHNLGTTQHYVKS
jgi:hypothetical protein